MIIAGKCPPEPEELEAAKNRGFDKVELYLERKHLDQIQSTTENIRESDVEVVSVHTPHVHIDGDKNYFSLADQLANELDAYLVFHTQYMHQVHIPQIEEELDLVSNYGYENQPGSSKISLENIILNKEHDLVLDTAHFFISDPEDYVNEIEDLVESYGSHINLVHLCDSTVTEDGLPFGEGSMDMEKICQAIEESGFDGTVVLEVMPEHQEDARNRWEEYTSHI